MAWLAAALVWAAVCLPAGAAAAPVRQGAVAAPDDRIVVVVSVDGLSSRALRVLGRRGAPHLHRMMRAGASTLNARTAYEQTLTLPNHAGMLTGRRVGGPAGHHVADNDDVGGLVRQRDGTYVPGLFDVAHDAGLSTALYASKAKFALFDRTWDARHGAADRVGVDDGRDKIDRFVVDTPGRLVRRLAWRLRTVPVDVTFLHLALPDRAGHRHGFLGGRYLAAVRRSDALIGRILATVRRDSRLRGRVSLVVTADHGGARVGGHGQASRRANYTVPFLAWGAGVGRGLNLYTLNPERTRPGTRRSGYARPPIRNIDAAGTATALLGLPSPSTLARTTPLEVS